MHCPGRCLAGIAITCTWLYSDAWAEAILVLLVCWNILYPPCILAYYTIQTKSKRQKNADLYEGCHNTQSSSLLTICVSFKLKLLGWLINFNVQSVFTDKIKWQCVVYRIALENLSSLEKKHNDQAEKLQKEITTLQKEAKGLLSAEVF